MRETDWKQAGCRDTWHDGQISQKTTDERCDLAESLLIVCKAESECFKLSAE